MKQTEQYAVAEGPASLERSNSRSDVTRACQTPGAGSIRRNGFVIDAQGHYHPTRAITREDILAEASSIHEDVQVGQPINTVYDAQEWLRARIGHLEHEVFVALWLDNGGRVIEMEELFRGTNNTCSVWPREVVKSALARNADTVVFGHNHPGQGWPEPSLNDEKITRQLKEALALIDVGVNDHLVVNATGWVSFLDTGRL